jgi:hypothetical protein
MVIKRVECSSGEGTVDIFGEEGEEWEWRESFFFTGKGVERELFTERNGGSSRHGGNGSTPARICGTVSFRAQSEPTPEHANRGRLVEACLPPPSCMQTIHGVSRALDSVPRVLLLGDSRGVQLCRAPVG